MIIVLGILYKTHVNFFQGYCAYAVGYNCFGRLHWIRKSTSIQNETILCPLGLSRCIFRSCLDKDFVHNLGMSPQLSVLHVSSDLAKTEILPISHLFGVDCRMLWCFAQIFSRNNHFDFSGISLMHGNSAKGFFFFSSTGPH